MQSNERSVKMNEKTTGKSTYPKVIGLDDIEAIEVLPPQLGIK